MPSVKNFVKLPLLLAIAGKFVGAGVPQEPAAGPRTEKTVNLVNLFATARGTRTNASLEDMRQDAFQDLLKTARNRRSRFLKRVTMPITLGLLMIPAAASQNRLGAEQEAASRIHGARDAQGRRAMVISFDTDVDLLADFTDDAQQDGTGNPESSDWPASVTSLSVARQKHRLIKKACQHRSNA